MREHDDRREARDDKMSTEQVRRIEGLARDFAKVWEAPATDHFDPKKLLRLPVEELENLGSALTGTRKLGSPLGFGNRGGRGRKRLVRGPREPAHPRLGELTFRTLSGFALTVSCPPDHSPFV